MIDPYPIASYNELRVVYDQVYGCNRLDPLPDASTVEAYYEDDRFYDEHSPPDWFLKEKVEHEAGHWQSYYRYLYRLISEDWGQYQGRVLDYGCGAGWWLDWLYKNTFRNHYGIEPSAQAQRVASNPSYIWDKERYARGVYEGITLILVLEHVVNPVEFLREKIKPLLAPDGRLIIVVPNEFNPLQKRINYEGFIQPVHVNYFTPPTLRDVLERAGFQVVHESATFPMELFPNVGINYIGNDDLGRRCHKARLVFEKAFGVAAFKLYAWLYRKWGIGRELVFVAEHLE